MTDELAIAVVPSPRITPAQFLTILYDNGIPSKQLGIGTGTVVDSAGVRSKVPGVIVAVIPSDSMWKVQAHAQLCGVAISPMLTPDNRDPL